VTARSFRLRFATRRGGGHVEAREAQALESSDPAT
jgi:hypothetical protein